MDARTGDTDARQRLLAGIPIAERRLDLAGISTALLEGGTGQPLVLLHGPGGHAAQWMKVLPTLLSSHHVVAPDLPGHGATVTGGVEVDPDRVMAWLEELILATCATPPDLLGHGVGGAVAARFARRHPGRVRSLVLVDALGMVPFSPDPELERALWGFLQQPSHDTHEILWDRCTFDLEAVKRRLGEAWAPLVAYNVGRARDPRLGAAQRALMEAFGFPAIDASELARIETPTTLIWGRHDRAARLVVAETASARYRWPLQVIEHAAADPHLEQPEAFLEALEALEAAQARTGDAQPAGSAR